jgi:hypothetical protein
LQTAVFGAVDHNGEHRHQRAHSMNRAGVKLIPIAHTGFAESIMHALIIVRLACLIIEGDRWK